MGAVGGVDRVGDAEVDPDTDPDTEVDTLDTLGTLEPDDGTAGVDAPRSWAEEHAEQMLSAIATASRFMGPLNMRGPGRCPRGPIPDTARMAAADRELKAEILVNATPERVWQVITDFDALPERSPELVKMIPVGKGGPRVGKFYIGINRRKAVIWPTRNRIAMWEPNKAMAWDTLESGARWIFELAPEGKGTRLVQRRPIPKKLALVGKVFAGGLLGGGVQHADELEGHMQVTLEGIKAAAEK